MKIYLGADHAGFELKEHIKNYLVAEMCCDVQDMGAFKKESADDYPDVIAPVARIVADDREIGKESYGIIFGRTGQGEAMVANRMCGIRCAVYYGGPQEIIMFSREHNDANMLSLGGQFLSLIDAQEAVKLWLATHYSGDERHIRRLQKF